MGIVFMQNKLIDKSARALTGQLWIPGDKSISHRSAMLASLGDKTVRITNYLNAADCISTVEGMRKLGARIERPDETELIVRGAGMRGLKEPRDVIDAGNSGTMLRLMLGILAAQPFFTAFTGDASLRERPMGRVVLPLTNMGAKLAGRSGGSRLPIAVLGGAGLSGIRYEMPVASAQVKSAILLAGMYADGETVVTEPYTSRDHTERMLEAFGVELHKEGTSVGIRRVEKLISPESIEVPGDISSAAFWLVAASIIPGSRLTLKNVGVNPTRTGVIDVLRAMGAHIALENERMCGKEPVADLVVEHAPLRGVSFGAEIMPRLIDEIPVLAVAAMFAEGQTTITGAGELRVKETDRLRAIETELNKFAPCVKATEDGLAVSGAGSLRFAECDSYDDHRIAMALAVAGAAGEGARIRGADCAGISYPGFYADLERAGM